MSHPFGDLISQYLHRKHGLSQAKLAAGILQSPSIISEMCQGKRLQGQQARARIVAIGRWLHQQALLTTLEEANALLAAAGMSDLSVANADERALLAAFTNPPPQPTGVSSPNLSRSTQYGSRSSVPNNLPTPLTSFIGRSAQIEQLGRHLQRTRLLTLTGMGGVGKTRLALEVGKTILDFRFGMVPPQALDSASPQPVNLKSKIQNLKFIDGVWFLDLAALTQPDLLPQTLLSIFKLSERPGQTASTTLIAYLATKRALLILDNCEHLVTACARLAEQILAGCPHVHLLATSREALRIGGELPWRVPSLTRPDPPIGSEPDAAPSGQPTAAQTSLALYEAVRLFVDRVQTIQPAFVLTSANAHHLATICQRLDGIPLALEMAAAQVTALTVTEIAAQLQGVVDARFQLLTTGTRTAAPRQQTLRATLEWSYRLLTPAEQWLLVRLAIFVGGWTVAAAEAVGADLPDSLPPSEDGTLLLSDETLVPLLTALVRKSLVIADQHAEQTRYRLLETVRQFATEQSRADGQSPDETQRRHSRYYLQLLAEQGGRLAGADQQAALSLIQADFANVRQAWQWAVAQREFALFVGAVPALYLVCEVQGNFREGVSLLTATLDALTNVQAAAITPLLQPLVGQVLARLGACEVMVDTHESAINHLQQSLQYAAEDSERAFAWAYLGLSDIERGELAASSAKLQQSLLLSRQCGDLGGSAHALFLLVKSANYNNLEAARLCAESLALWRGVGRPDRSVEVSNFLAWQLCCMGDYAQANRYWRENLPICRALGMESAVAWIYGCLGWVAWCQDDLAIAQQNLEKASELYRRLGSPSRVAMSLAELAMVLRSAGKVQRAVQLGREAVAIVRGTDNQLMLLTALHYLGAVLLGAGELAAARAVLTEVIQQAWMGRFSSRLVNPFYHFAELLVLESHAADLPNALATRGLAVTLLSCVRSQPATWQIFKDKAAQLQTQTEGSLPAEVCAAAIARGTSSALEEMVSAVLGATETE